METEAETLHPRDRREPNQIERRAKRVIALVIVESGSRMSPVDLVAQAQLRKELEEMRVRATDEMVEALYRDALETEGTREPTEVGCRLQRRRTVASLEQVMSGGEAGQSTADDDDVLAHRARRPK